MDWLTTLIALAVFLWALVQFALAARLVWLLYGPTKRPRAQTTGSALPGRLGWPSLAQSSAERVENVSSCRSDGEALEWTGLR
jgi:hypothetical protein